MRSTILLLLVALNAWMATGFPVHYPVDQLAAQGITLKYRSSPSGAIMVNPPRFSDWSQEERNQLRTSILEAGGKGALLPSSWAERTQRTFRAWWAFYLTQYPAKSENKQGKKRPNYFTAIDTSRDTIETNPETNDTSADEPQSEQSEANTSGLAGLYLSHFAHMDPAIICSRFRPEIVGLCIFLLVPAAVMIVEVVDMLHDRWTPEQFPERGRGRVRLSGPERQYTVLEKYEREKAAAIDQSQKWWGQRRRSK